MHKRDRLLRSNARCLKALVINSDGCKASKVARLHPGGCERALQQCGWRAMSQHGEEYQQLLSTLIKLLHTRSHLSLTSACLLLQNWHTCSSLAVRSLSTEAAAQRRARRGVRHFSKHEYNFVHPCLGETVYLMQ